MAVNRQTLVRTGQVLIVLAAVTAGIVLARALLHPKQEPKKPPAPGEIRGFGTLRDRSSGFQISYPRTWQQFDPKDPPREVPLVAGPGGNDFVLVRLCNLPQEIPPEAVSGLRPGFDQVIQRGGANVLEQKQIRLNGLAGFHYLYTFADQATQQQGVHSHYFLVDRATVYQIVFQALPVDDFKALSGTFDKIANSFMVIPRTGSVAPCANQGEATSPPGPPAGSPPPA